MPHLFTENVIPRLLAWRREGLGCALVTLVGIEGTSPRSVGSQMAVASTGDTLGLISGGCAEAAIVAEALLAIEASEPRTVRYGAGSPYIDVRLPCGSGIDVHFDPTIPTAVLAEIGARIAAREPVTLAIGHGHGDRTARLTGTASPVARDGTVFLRHYRPATRIVIAGRGIIVDYVAQFASLLGWDVVVASPEADTLQRIAPFAETVRHLTRPEEFDPATLVDSATSVVLLFHDHEWEPAILARCEATDAFHVGALGSRASHAQRKVMLEALGCSRAFIDRIRSPVGLDIGGKSPPEIALAIVAEVLALAPAPQFDAGVTPRAAAVAHCL